jgi:peptidoglycan hydrolase CwlO-like protein
MRDACRTTILANRPAVTTRQAVAFCLEKLIEDTDHLVDDELASGLSYKDLLGALVLATDSIDELGNAECEIEELERDLSDFQDEVSTLESQRDDLENELVMARETRDDLEAHIEDLEGDLL